VTRLVHRALVYGHEDDFIRHAVPFVQEGLAAGDLVLVVCSAGGIDRLRRTLGHAASSVDFRDGASWYAQPTRAVAGYSSYLLDHLDARIRVIAEPGGKRRTPAEVAEWTRYEALVNQAFAGVDASVLCTYDQRNTPPGMIDGAVRTHPELVADAGPSPNQAYLDPDTVYAQVDGAPLPPPPPHAVSFPVTGDDLSELRAFIGGHARGHGLSPARLNDLLVGATEVATNAVRHGLPPVGCRLWAEDGDVVIQVTDAGCWEPPPLSGFLPPDMAATGFGLWAVRMLCPLVQLRSGPEGTTVRLRVPAV
jgi:anti-sigma regulatory factor (Ser/Thr protein kinase)